MITSERPPVYIGKNKNLKQLSKISLGNWLNEQNWNLWTTLSTGYELSLPAARRSMIRMHDIVNKDNKCKVFWAAEEFDVKEGFHIHSLWSFDNNIHDRETYRAFVRNWREICKTKNANVYSDTYRPGGKAAEYLSKYITKRITDYDYFDGYSNNLERINNNTMRFLGKEQLIARTKIQKYCKKNGLNYDEFKNEKYKEISEVKYDDILKIEKEIYEQPKTYKNGK